MILQYAQYGVLYILIPVFVAIYYVGFLIKKRRMNRFLSPKMCSKLVPSLSPTRRFWKRALIILALCCLIFTLMRPQYGRIFREERRYGQSIMVGLDTSFSMQAEDVAPSRLTQAKKEIQALMNNLKGDEIGLMTFSGIALVQCPLTQDLTAFKLFLDGTTVGSIPVPGTNLASAIEQGLKSMKTQKRTFKTMILYSDGEALKGDAIGMAKKAAKAGVVIHTIGVGTANGDPLPIRNDQGTVIGYKKDANGEVVLSKLDEATLSKIASITGGAYFVSGENGFVADNLYKVISNME